MKKLIATLFTITLLAICTAKANQIYVDELVVNPNVIVHISTYINGSPWSGNVYAGVNQLNIGDTLSSNGKSIVGGTQIEGFCIDPFHLSSADPLLYDELSLELAPKSPGPMGLSRASDIRALWATAYHANMTDVEAAALQVAIWSVVADLNNPAAMFTSTGTTKSDQAIADATTLLNTIHDLNYGGGYASLTALSGAGQDYVVDAIPDSGTTVALLGLSLFAISAIRSAKLQRA